MDMFLKDGDSVENLGHREGVASFFDTIACRLEPDGRGTRFPVVSTRLRLGRVTGDEAARAVRELSLIAPELRKLPAERVLWTERVPDASRSGSAGDRLIAPDGRSLLDHFATAAQRAAGTGDVLYLRCPDQDRRQLFGLSGVSTMGIAWAVLAYRLFPAWMIAPSTQSVNDPSGIPLWTFGILAPAFAVPTFLGIAIPAIKLWSVLHPWSTAVWYVFVAGVWIVLSLTR